jgi:CheY-like chemotaxis protein
MRVLYVDDQKDFLVVARKFLEQEGIDIVTADSVEEAMIFLKKNDPCDVIVSDYVMPGKNGIDFLKAIQLENL